MTSNSSREDFPLPAPLTSRTPLPRFRAASASIRRRKSSSNLPSAPSSASTVGSRQNRVQIHNLMEIDSDSGPSNPSSTISNPSYSSLSAWDDEEQTSYRTSSLYSFLNQPPYSPPHSPRFGTLHNPTVERSSFLNAVNRDRARSRESSPNFAYGGSFTSDDERIATRPVEESLSIPQNVVHRKGISSDNDDNENIQAASAQLLSDDEYSRHSEDLDPGSQTRSQDMSQAGHSSLTRLLNPISDTDDSAEQTVSQSTFVGKGKGKQQDGDEAVKNEGEEQAVLFDDVPSTRTRKSLTAKGKQKATAGARPLSLLGSCITPNTSNVFPSKTSSIPPDILASHALSTYTCPICFCPPTNATMTPCGHIACGSCLFAAVKTALRRETMMGGPKDDGGPRCPVCRAVIPGWDGKGGGVIGLIMQTVTVA